MTPIELKPDGVQYGESFLAPLSELDLVWWRKAPPYQLDDLFEQLGSQGELGAASAEDVAALRRMDQVLGVLDVAAAPGGIERSGLTDEEITQRCRDMDAARAAKDYATSDAIRDELHAAGVEVRIGREGTTWRRRAQLD